MKITSLDIRNKRFETRWGRGIDPEDVRVFLDAVASELEGLTRDNGFLKDNLRKAEAGLEEYHEREKALKDTLVLAQKMTEDIKAGALKEAEAVISEARIVAEQIVSGSHSRVGQVVDEIQELKGQRTQLLASLRATLETHHKVLEITERQFEKRDAEDDKLLLRASRSR